MEELEEILSRPIIELDVSVRVQNNLLQGIGWEASISEILRLSEKQILEKRAIGKKSLTELKDMLAEHGIPLDSNAYEKPCDYSHWHQRAGKERFAALVHDKPFELAVKTYWSVKRRNIPFMDFLEVFKSYVKDNYFYFSTIIEETSVSAESAERILRHAASVGLIPKVVKKDKQAYQVMLTMIQQGYTMKQIAEEKGITRSGVQAYMKRYNLLGMYKERQRQKAGECS